MNPIQYITPLDDKSYKIAYEIMYNYLGREVIFNNLWVKNKWILLNASDPKQSNKWTAIRKVIDDQDMVLEIDRSTRNVKITVTLNAHE